MHVGNQSFIKLNVISLDGLIPRYSPPPPIHTKINSIETFLHAASPDRIIQSGLRHFVDWVAQSV